MTDAELIRRSLDDAERFRTVFDRHFPAVWGYLRRRAGAGLADDLASETFTLAFSARSRYRPERESALPWLLGIAANLVARHHRSETRRLRAYARSADGSTHEHDAESVLGRLAAAAQGRALAEALADLRPEERETLFLSAIAGLSHAEIAAALGVAPGTVGARLHRGRRRLEAALAHSTEGAVT